MEDNEPIEIRLRNLIKTKKNPSYLTTNKKEISIRCPYCGDSIKHNYSAHLYIALTPPFKFHCKKCETAGVLNAHTMRDMGIFDNSLSIGITSANKNLLKTIPKNNVITRKAPKLPIVDTDASRRAVDYFNSRYNSDFDNEYIINKFKAVTDANEFFKLNYINKPSYFDFDNSIGFVSSDGSHVIFRDISGNSKLRYYNLNLNPGNDDVSNKIYNIKTNINVMHEKIKLVITEGIFDIIGVYQHFYKDTDNENNTIFAAACGKSYAGVIQTFIRKGFLDLDIVIYSDADVPIGLFKDIKANSAYIKNIPVTVYYNKIEKDFGIPKERISLQKAIL